MKLTLFTKRQMNITRIALLAGALSMTASCEDFLDVNNNPNGPEVASANLYLPPILHKLVDNPQTDGRFFGRYVQNWYLIGTSISTWDRMGFDPGSDGGAWVWRSVYWSWGQNLEDMKQKAEAEQRWDVLGIGVLIKGIGWMDLASLHGDIIVKQAIDQTRFYFDYDTEEYALQEAKKLIDSSIVLLKRTDGAVDARYLAVGDKMYNGDRSKWLKYAYGVRAMLLNRYSNKASLYNAAAVIANVDSSFAGNADDLLLPFPARSTDNADFNYFGQTAGTLSSYRQTQFAVSMFNGTVFGGAVDPRMSRVLAPDSTGAYRGVDINAVGWGAMSNTATRPWNLYGYASSPPAGAASRYIFSNKSRYPVMTYSQLQFIKAEAAFRSGDKATALQAYTRGISSHIDFVNTRNAEDGQLVMAISPAEKDAFLNNTAVVPTDPNALTMWMIMSQKYVTQFGWGFFEQWMDMRRFHYTDTYGSETKQAFPGFTPPTNLYTLNAGKLVYRVRPRYNSEYVWNREALSKITPISGLADDYHTSELWIIQP